MSLEDYVLLESFFIIFASKSSIKTLKRRFWRALLVFSTQTMVKIYNPQVLMLRLRWYVQLPICQLVFNWTFAPVAHYALLVCLHWRVYFQLICCVFWPANRCSAHRSLVEVIFLTLKQLFPWIFPLFSSISDRKCCFSIRKYFGRRPPS